MMTRPATSPAILDDGLVPDATMDGCFMEFAVEGGRTELARQFSELALSYSRWPWCRQQGLLRRGSHRLAYPAGPQVGQHDMQWA